MKKILSLILLLALALSLTACGPKYSEEAAQVYEAVCKARGKYARIQENLYKTAQLVDADPDKIRTENFAYLAENLGLPDRELRLGAARTIKGDDWHGMTDEDKEMMAAVAEVGMMIYGDPMFGENALHQFCLGAVNGAYWENGDRLQILKDLGEAEDLLKNMEDDPLYEQLRSYLFGLYDYMYYTSEENLEDYCMGGEIIAVYAEELNNRSRPLEELFGVPETT